ncbi:hypothetical protein [Rhodoferax sp. BAB1]|uniref:hypothetical protein n=1 Tax=Rhodoferax sp. BAB1 TaxID=2741720 RepID=UPI00157643AF|nr:hypothetical protein [Rhodoferax sp. BAB1]QKO23394.1 hypothetical protein HTY51_16575 [Rhodoferax sp. BAB1]
MTFSPSGDSHRIDQFSVEHGKLRLIATPFLPVAHLAPAPVRIHLMNAVDSDQRQHREDDDPEERHKG